MEEQRNMKHEPRTQPKELIENGSNIDNTCDRKNTNSFGVLKFTRNPNLNPNSELLFNNLKGKMMAPIERILDPNKHSIVCFQDACASIQERGTQGSKKKGRFKEKSIACSK